jgi:hypothetical protein
MTIARRILGLALVLIGLYVTLAVGGMSTIVACERVEPGRVDCTTQSAPLGIPWGEKRPHPGVVRAIATDYEGLGRTFVLELETVDGTVALSGDMTVNERETAERINAFLQDPREDSLVVNYVDWGRLVVGIFFVGGFLGIYPGLYLLFTGFWRDLVRRVEWRLVAGIACILFGIFSLYVFGRVTTLTCTRVERTQVNCRQAESWAGLIPLGGTRTIHDVEAAEADRRRSSNPSRYKMSSYTYHVKLRTQEGIATAIECFTFGEAQQVAERVNAFIADTEADCLQVDNFSWASTSLGTVCVIMPCAILGGIAWIHYFGSRAAVSRNQPSARWRLMEGLCPGTKGP